MELALFSQKFNDEYQQEMVQFVGSQKTVLKIEKYCVKLLKLVEIYDDKKSGKEEDQDGYIGMLNSYQ